MLQVDDGSGLYTTVGLLNSVIVELDDIEVKGVQNHAHIISCINKINSAIEAIKKRGPIVEVMNADDTEDGSGEEL